MQTNVTIKLKEVEFEVEESVLIEALEAKGITAFKPEPKPNRKPQFCVDGRGSVSPTLGQGTTTLAKYAKQGRVFYTEDDAKAFVAMQEQMAAVVGIEPKEGDWGWDMNYGCTQVSDPLYWQPYHALGLTAKTKEELEPKVAVFQRFQQIEKVRLEDLE